MSRREDPAEERGAPLLGFILQDEATPLSCAEGVHSRQMDCHAVLPLQESTESRYPANLSAMRLEKSER